MLFLNTAREGTQEDWKFYYLGIKQALKELEGITTGIYLKKHTKRNVITLPTWISTMKSMIIL